VKEVECEIDVTAGVEQASRVEVQEVQRSSWWMDEILAGYFALLIH
jgi:hypothetical protein